MASSNRPLISPPPRKWFAIHEMGILVALALLVAFLSLSAPRFLDSENLFNILRQFSFIAIIAMGETFVLVAGGIDLSVGSVAGLAGVVCCAFISQGYGVVAGVLAGVGVGLLCGLFNGCFTAYVKLPYFIVTLATMSLARGFVYVLTQGQPIVNLNPVFFRLGQGSIGSIPVPVAIMVLTGVCGYVLLNRTVFGRQVAALGGNEQVALLSGLPISRIKILVLVICAVCSAVSGITLASRLNSGQPTLANGYELDAIAAVVIGGTSLFGGSGSILGTLTGAALMGVMRNGLVLMNVSAYWQSVAVGGVILLACSVEQISRFYRFCSARGSGSQLRKKKMTAVAAVVLILAIAMGYGLHSRFSTHATRSGPTIAVVPKLIHPYFEAARRGATDEARKLGVNLIWQAPLTSDPAQQAQIIEDLLTRGVDGIAVAPVDDQVLLPFLKRAHKQRIPVLTWDVDSSDRALRVGYVGTDNYAAGEIAGREAARIVAPNSEYAVMTGSLGALNLNQRLQGFEKGIRESGSHSRVALEASDDNADRALAQAEAILKGHPNVGLIFCTTGTGTPQAAKAVREAHLASQVTVVGFDALDDTLQAVRDGSVRFIIAQKPYDMGRIAVRYLDDYLQGQIIPSQTDTGAYVIDRQNVDRP